MVLSVAMAMPAQAVPRLLVDMYTGEVLYAEEAGQPWHPASLTKLMTALVTFEAIAAQRVSLSTPVIMSARALKAPPSKVGMPVDTAFTLEDALYLLIVKSANDVAIAVAETVSGSVEKFVGEMNLTALALEMTATHYVNPHGLHDASQMTSARDLAILALTIRARHPQFAKMFATQAVQLGKSKLATHNNLLTRLAGTTGMKTGFVCAAGLNIVATVERDNRALMAIILGSSSSRERGEMAAELVLKGLSGQLTRSARSVVDLPNLANAPVNMRPYLCGKDAKAYVEARAEAYPLGLEGQPTNLTDTIVGQIYRAHTLGRLRNVPIPRPRPAWMTTARTSVVTTAPEQNVPFPRPRPTRLRPGI